MPPPSSIPAAGTGGAAADTAPAVGGVAGCGTGKKAVIVGAGECGGSPGAWRSQCVNPTVV